MQTHLAQIASSRGLRLYEVAQAEGPAYGRTRVSAVTAAAAERKGARPAGVRRSAEQKGWRRPLLGWPNVQSPGAAVAAPSPPGAVASFDNKGWSLHGAPWFQPVAISRKSDARENRRIKPNRCCELRPVAAMVRRGSTVRVRKRALQKRRTERLRHDGTSLFPR